MLDFSFCCLKLGMCVRVYFVFGETELKEKCTRLPLSRKLYACIFIHVCENCFVFVYLLLYSNFLFSRERGWVGWRRTNNSSTGNEIRKNVKARVCSHKMLWFIWQYQTNLRSTQMRIKCHWIWWLCVVCIATIQRFSWMAYWKLHPKQWSNRRKLKLLNRASLLLDFFFVFHCHRQTLLEEPWNIGTREHCHLNCIRWMQQWMTINGQAFGFVIAHWQFDEAQATR